MIRLAVFVSAIVVSSATAAGAAVTPGPHGGTSGTISKDAETPSTATATANNSAKANVGQKKKTYMTPTANPMRTEDCSRIELSGQATLNGQPMNDGSSNAAIGTGPKAVGQGINKGSGGTAKCWEEGGSVATAPQ